MKKIAIVIGGLGFGGIESCNVTQFRYFDKTQYSVDFLLNSPESVKNKKYADSILEQGGHLVFLMEHEGNKIQRWKSLYNTIRKGKYNAVHFHVSFPSHMSSVLIARMAGSKNIIVTSHARGTSVKMSSINEICQYLSRKIFPIFVKTRLAVSEEAGKWMYGSWYYIVIFNGIDFAKFKSDRNARSAIRENLDLGKDTVIVGHIGRFVSEKNHEFLIDFFNEFHKIQPNSVLLMIGAGMRLEYILGSCKKLGLPFRHIDNTDRPEAFLNAMDIFVLPSHVEGFPLVALEAQAVGLPVLCSDRVPQGVKMTNRIIFESLNASLLKWCEDANHLLELAATRENIVDEKNREIFDIRNVIKRITNFY